MLDAHSSSTRPTVPVRAVRPKTATEKQLCALGPFAQAFLTGAAAAGHTRLGAELGELLALEAVHGRDALTGATAFGRWRAGDVRSILAVAFSGP